MSDKIYEKKTGLALLRESFPENQISILPRPYKKDSPKDKCEECGGYHGLPAVHLKYVGHAALTDRLLDVDPNWNWEPLALENGLPKLDSNKGMWIKLTVCGLTRLGYGHAGDKTGPDAIKEIIGDALRNAAMRFGAALELWHKGDLHVIEDDKTEKNQITNYADLGNTIIKIGKKHKGKKYKDVPEEELHDFVEWMKGQENINKLGTEFIESASRYLEQVSQ